MAYQLITENVYGAGTRIKYKVEGGNIFFDKTTGEIVDCDKLVKVTIPDSVTELGEGVFLDCSALKSISIPQSITEIPFYTFVNCSSLEKVEISNGVIGVWAYTFSDCDSLTELEIPNSVSYLGTGLFDSCENLRKVVIPDSVTEIIEDAFWGCENVTIYGYSGTYAEEFAKTHDIPFVAMKSKTVNAKKQAVNQTGDLVLMVDTKANGTAALSQVRKTDKREIYIEDTAAIGGIKYKVTSVKAKAFSKCENVKTINFNIKKAIKIKNGAFKGINTEKMTIKVDKKMSKKELNKFKKALKNAGYIGVVKR